MSINKLQAAFEQQFFNHIFKDGDLESSVQTDGLSVIQKHKDYMIIKTALDESYKRLLKIQWFMVIMSGLFLAGSIWNIVALKKEPFWINVVQFEMSIFGQTFTGKPFLLFNILTMLTTIVSCLIYFVMAVISMQARNTRSVTSAMYFQSACKVGVAAITCSSGVTLIFGTMTISGAAQTLGTILFCVQVAILLALQLWLMLYSYNKTKQLILILVDFHQFLTSYR